MIKLGKRQIFDIPDDIASVVKTLENKGFEAYLIGGCVRDTLIKRKPKDWDIATNASPEKIVAAFPKSFYENDYGTVGVVNENVTDETLKVVEVTPYRLETKYTDKRRPDSVIFGGEIGNDIKRRDFTINAIALNLGEKSSGGYEGTLVDLYNGQNDLKNGLIKTVGEPIERFSEDALRIIRAIRIAVELGFTIEQKTEAAIETTSSLLRHVAKERIRDEFLRILMSDKPMVGLQILKKLNLIRFIAPELEYGFGVTQNKAHTYDVWEHTIRSVQHAADKDWPIDVRLGALFHDIGKPATRIWSPEKGDWTFHGHDVVGAKITAKVLANLHFSNREIEKIIKLVRWHMFFSDTEQISLSAVRRIITKVGPENVWDLMKVRMCDRIGTGRPKESPYRLRKYQSMIEEVMRDPISVKMLNIDGHGIMKIANIPPGPKIGRILNVLLDEVLENPASNRSEILNNRAVELAKLADQELHQISEKGKDKRDSQESKEISKIRKKYWVE
jgi:poly(A) polymerase/tRNA nucleotidyltransferase (CCA-adding enzyme)